MVELKKDLSSIVERAEELYLDVDLRAVREWKDRHPGSKAIGFLPVYVPREIVAACGALPVGVFGAGDQLEIIKGDACFQSYLCHLPRSVIELALSRRLDCLDGMLFPSICDVIRNLSGIWKMMFPDKLSRYVDLPQNFDPEIGGRFFSHELEELTHDVASLTGHIPSAAEMRATIELYNQNRRLHEALYESRRKEPWRVPTSELYLLTRAGNVLPVGEHNSMLRDYLEAARRVSRRPMDMARVVVTGAFCEQPPLDLLRTLERAGCYIVEDDFVLGARWLRADVSTRGDPIEALADAYLCHSVAHSSVFIGQAKKGEQLVDDVRRSAAEGVLFAAPSFCHPSLLDQPMLQAALDEAKIPYTSFKYSENTGQFQVIREQAGTFADSIKLWSEA